MEPPVNVSDDITTIINLAFLSASESMIITASPVDGEKYMQSVVIPSAAVIPLIALPQSDGLETMPLKPLPL